MYIYVLCAFWFPGMSEENSASSETGVIDGHEPPCGCCKLNLGPLQEQKKILLTIEPSLQLSVDSVFKRPIYRAS